MTTKNANGNGSGIRLRPLHFHDHLLAGVVIILFSLPNPRTVNRVGTLRTARESRISRTDYRTRDSIRAKRKQKEDEKMGNEFENNEGDCDNRPRIYGIYPQFSLQLLLTSVTRNLFARTEYERT